VFRDFLFDESLPGLGVNEDVDFSYRVSRKWRNLYAPKARAAHLRPSLEREGGLAYLRQELGSSWFLYKKNLPKDPLHLLAFLWHQAGVCVRFLFRRCFR
jgi:GT2 family glycosyltransferase